MSFLPSKLTLPKPGTREHFSSTIRHLIESHEAQLVVPYENNRGAVGVTKHGVSSIADSFDPLFLGTFSVVMRPDGAVQLIDGHSRTEAMLKLYKEKNKDFLKMLDDEISLDIYHWDDRIAVYGKLAEVKRHNSAQNFTNPDYALGKVWTDIAAEFKFDRRLAPSFLNVAMSLKEQGIHKFTMADVHDTRMKIDQLQRLVGKCPFKSSIVAQLWAGCEYIRQVHNHLRIEGVVAKKQTRIALSPYAKKLMKSSAYNLGLLVGFLGSYKLDTSDPKAMARTSLRQFDHLNKLSKTFMRKGKGLIDDTKFYQILTPRRLRAIG